MGGGRDKRYKGTRKDFCSDRNTLYLNYGDSYTLSIHLTNSEINISIGWILLNRISTNLKE